MDGPAVDAETQVGNMHIDKEKYLTPSQRTRFTCLSHNSQYCRRCIYMNI